MVEDVKVPTRGSAQHYSPSTSPPSVPRCRFYLTDITVTYCSLIAYNHNLAEVPSQHVVCGLSVSLEFFPSVWEYRSCVEAVKEINSLSALTTPESSR
jgi:hypothetical protein